MFEYSTIGKFPGDNYFNRICTAKLKTWLHLNFCNICDTFHKERFYRLTEGLGQPVWHGHIDSAKVTRLLTTSCPSFLNRKRIIHLSIWRDNPCLLTSRASLVLVYDRTYLLQYIVEMCIVQLDQENRTDIFLLNANSTVVINKQWILHHTCRLDIIKDRTMGKIS